MHHIVDQCGYENRLTSAGKTSDTQPQRRRHQTRCPICQRVKCDPCFIAETGQFCQLFPRENYILSLPYIGTREAYQQGSIGFNR